jgi:hypothetical protein
MIRDDDDDDIVESEVDTIQYHIHEKTIKLTNP